MFKDIRRTEMPYILGKYVQCYILPICWWKHNGGIPGQTYGMLHPFCPQLSSVRRVGGQYIPFNLDVCTRLNATVVCRK